MPTILRNLLAVFISLAITYPVNAREYQLDLVAEDLVHPWTVVPLEQGGFLVTERPGRLLHIAADGSKTEISNVPETYFAGQGGFFDLILDRDFSSNKTIFLSYARGDEQANGTAVERAQLIDGSLKKRELIFQATPLKDTPQHYSGRMLQLPDSTLLISVGEGFEYRESAQSLSSELGKVIRITTDGDVPADNPFAQSPKPRIFTYGHRNIQGLVYDPDRDMIYLHEHGPRGGDELNVLQAGNNYGWPAITYGLDYSGAYVSPLTHWQGMEQPLLHWTPSIAPSGMARYTGKLFPQWQGDLFVSTLVDKDVKRLEMENGKVLRQHSLFSELDKRIRDVRTGPDGALYLLTDGSEAQLIRARPKT